MRTHEVWQQKATMKVTSMPWPMRGRESRLCEALLAPPGPQDRPICARTLRTGFIPLLPQSAPSRPKVLPFAQTKWGQFGAACPKPARNPKVSQSGPKCARVPKVLPFSQTNWGQFGAAWNQTCPNSETVLKWPQVCPGMPRCPKAVPFSS